MSSCNKAGMKKLTIKLYHNQFALTIFFWQNYLDY
jgi:hypothetical protein